MKVVLDTNVLLVSFGSCSPYRPIFNALRSGKFELCVSNDILLEYEEIIGRQTRPEIAKNVLELLLALPNVSRSDPTFFWWKIIDDPSDNKFVDCYVSAGADYIVTNDKHFSHLTIREFPPVRLIKIADFLNWVQSL